MSKTEIVPRIQPTDSIILLVDHQTMTIDWVKSLPKTTVIASCRVLARMGVTFSIPLFLTTTMEEYVGPTLPEIQEVAPDAFAARFKRGGILSCFDQPELVDRAQGHGPHQPDPRRPHHRHLSVLGRPRCGSPRLQRQCHRRCLRHHVHHRRRTTFDRLRGLGATVSVVNQIVTELENDFGSPDGLRAQQILSDEVISKLNS